MAMGELGRRWLVAGVGIPVALVMVYLGGWILAGLLGIVAAVGAREFYGLVRHRGGRPLDWLGIPAAAALVLLTAPSPDFAVLATVAWTLSLSLLLGGMAASVWTRGVEGGPLAASATTLAGALYTGGTLAFGVLVRHRVPDGLAAGDLSPWSGTLLLCFILAVTWVGDSAAFFAGKRWGKARLLPAVSPGKTVVGGVAGLMGAVAAGAVWAGMAQPWLEPFHLSPLRAAVLAGLLGIAAQTGDLAESVLKREAGVKDSGSLLPGHGGMLDRFDALFFTIPVGYGLIRLLELLP